MSYNIPLNIFQSGSNIGVLKTVTGIDGLSVAETSLYTVPTGKKAYVLGAIVEMTAETGASVVGNAGIKNTTGAVDLIASAALTGLDDVGKIFYLQPSVVAAYTWVPAASVITFNLTTAFTVATVVTLSVSLIGMVK